VTDRVGALFFMLINQAMGSIFETVNTCKIFPWNFSLTIKVTEEKAVFLRERASKMYRVSPYYLTKNAAEIPVEHKSSINEQKILGTIIFSIFVCCGLLLDDWIPK
jgi:hypothetical protein